MPNEKKQETVESQETTETKKEDTNRPFYSKIPEAVGEALDKIRGSYKPSLMSDSDADSNVNNSKETTEENKDEQQSDKVESNESKSSDDDYKEQEIPYHLVKAARERGWTDDRIVRVAEVDMTILEDLYEDAKFELEKEDKKEKPTKPKIEVDEETLKKLRENYGDEVVDKVISPLLDNQNKLMEKMDVLEENHQSQIRESNQSKVIELFNKFNTALDKASKDFPEFGKWDDLPKRSDGTPVEGSPEYEVRSKIYDTMVLFANGGYPEHKAIEQAINWYLGTQGDKRAERKVVEELNDEVKKHTPKPTAKKVKKQFRNEDEAKASIVQQAKEAAGIK